MENKEVVAKEVVKTNRSHESLFGTLLLAALIIFTITSIVGVGFVAYAKWHASKQQSEKPSITGLATAEEQVIEKSVDRSTVPEEKQTKPDAGSREAAVLKLKGTAVSVLNGGAAKGSAAIVADLLKKAGYVKTSPGNATSDYVGVTVYYTSGLEESAQIIKEALVQKYPGAVVKTALPGNKETSTSPITVILGK